MKKNTKHVHQLTDSIWVYEKRVRIRGQRALELFCLTGFEAGNKRILTKETFKNEFREATQEDCERIFAKPQSKIILPERKLWTAKESNHA